MAPVLVSDPLPVEMEALLRRRHETGVDLYDEIWEGVLHMTPGPTERHADLQMQLAMLLAPPAKAAGLRTVGTFNVGQPDDYRVPDGGLRRPGPYGVYAATAALVFEVVSPGDESWAKLPFYAAHDVDELLIVDPDTHRIDWLGLTDGEYRPIERSGLIDLSSDSLAGRIDWPAAD